MRRITFFLKTTDPDVIFVVPGIDSEITWVDRNDPPEYVAIVPDNGAYVPKNVREILMEDAIAELEEVVEEYNELFNPLEIDYSQVAIVVTYE